MGSAPDGRHNHTGGIIWIRLNLAVRTEGKETGHVFFRRGPFQWAWVDNHTELFRTQAIERCQRSTQQGVSGAYSEFKLSLNVTFPYRFQLTAPGCFRFSNTIEILGELPVVYFKVSVIAEERNRE